MNRLARQAHTSRISGRVLSGLRAGALALALCGTNGVTNAALAQNPTVARELLAGRVTTDSARAVIGATISVTMAPSRALFQTTTDSSGRYRLLIEESSGDYLLHVSALGYRSERRRITRVPSITAPPIDLVIKPEIATLVAVNVTAKKARPQRETLSEPNGSETGFTAGGIAGQLPPELAGDVASTVGTLPGMLQTSAGISALGLGPDQVSSNLNGLAFLGSSLPRDAVVRTRAVTSVWDPGRGGFSSARIEQELGPGNLISQRTGHVLTNTPGLQLNDPNASRFGREQQAIQLSTGGSGILTPSEKWFYNFGVQGSRRTSSVMSLTTSAEDALHAVGLSGDSVRVILSALDRLGIPTGLSRIPSGRTDDAFSFVARIDHTPWSSEASNFEPPPVTWNLTAFANADRTSALGTSPVATATLSTRADNYLVGLQGGYSRYLGLDYLNELRAGVTARRAQTVPYLDAPEGRVVVSADPGDASALALASFGGNAAAASSDARVVVEATNETVTLRGAHRIKLKVESRFDSYHQQQAENGRGVFTYASLSDLVLNQPSSYSRTLGDASRDGKAWSGASSIGDAWRVSDRLNLTYGARLDANRFLTVPPVSQDVASRFGVDASRVPNTIGFSPRLGFTYRYGGTPLPGGVSVGNLGSTQAGPRGVLRGGVGVFRNALSPTLLAPALIGNGFTERLSCVGSATPVPGWDQLIAGGPSPSACLTSGSAAFASDVPRVQVFGRDFTASQSTRMSLGISAVALGLRYSADATLSENLHQPGSVDLNLRSTPQFFLANEGNRPVFVSAASIAVGSGLTTASDARLQPGYGSVISAVSDLRSVSRQLTVVLAPDARLSRALISMAYTLGDIQEERRGFDGSTFGSPQLLERAPGLQDVRHQIQIQGGYQFNHGFSATLFQTFTSGQPYTPIVSGDVNGDGMMNDRAFVFDPARADSAMASGLRTLLSTGPREAQDCLRAQLGRAADRSSCRAPWTAGMNMRVLYSPPSKNFSQPRATVALNIANPLTGFDHLLHGADQLHGWGSANIPDPVLYRVRGFDPAKTQFRYEVNPGFGSTSPLLTAFSRPFRVSIDVNLTLGAPAPQQQMERMLIKGRRGQPGPKLTSAQIARRLSGNVPSMFTAVLGQSDSLLLSPAQRSALAQGDSLYRARAAVLWNRLGSDLSDLPDAYDAPRTLAKIDAVTEQVWDLARADVETIRSILSPVQIALLDRGLIGTFLHATEKITVRMYSF